MAVEAAPSIYRKHAAPSIFGIGGVLFALVDRALHKRSSAGTQLLAMLTDFLPEAMALGALLATNGTSAVLLALMIALDLRPVFPPAYGRIRSYWAQSC